ncbi:MAG: MBL fold metallo-hydrolase [Lachnospiraceae bacterium]|nr:MBL fold metallo-hydrolase [Lachnospiraceae bacterium]
MQDYLVNVCGDDSNASWLIKGEKACVLYEAGMAYSADKMIENIKNEIGDRPLDAVILSHSHYDHVAGLPFVKKVWPNAKVYGSAYAAKILEKQSARDLMRSLSSNAAKGAGLDDVPEYDENFLRIDETVKEGDVLQIGDIRIDVYETPGHTKCSLSYLINQDVMLTSETLGVFYGDWYLPCYLVGYEMTLDAAKKLRKAPAKRILISHRGVLEETDLGKIWDHIDEKLRETKEEIVDIIRTFETEEERKLEMKRRFHEGKVSEKEHPEAAFLLNAAATLKLIERECMEDNA